MTPNFYRSLALAAALTAGFTARVSCADGAPASLPVAGFLYSTAAVQDDPGLPHQTVYARWWPHIDFREARRLLGRPGVVFVDGRGPIQWGRSHLPGALLLPPSEFGRRFPRLRARLRRARVVVCYCHGYDCGASDLLAKLLSEQGLRNLAVYPGGFLDWMRARGPMQGHDFPPGHSIPAPWGPPPRPGPAPAPERP